MYKIIGIKGLIQLVGVVALLCAAVLALISEPSTAWEWLRTGSSGLTATAALFYLLGETAAFPWLCRHTPLQLLFPDLEGAWEATTDSNWPVVSQLLPADQRPAIRPDKTKLDVVVRARLSHVSMTMESHDRYSKSQTLLVGLRKDETTGGVRMHYVYLNETKRPQDTDTSVHRGAAYLDLCFDKGVVTRMEGVYWTDRNWPKGLNTAGTITIARPAGKAD
ncbi:MAG TPA: hypothetical protein VK196_19345 [Magnetospirillum sp.]|nr:hypothetical protein [Magnetospirillum sp.]